MRLTAILLALTTVAVASPTKRDPQCVCPALPNSSSFIRPSFKGPSAFTCNYVGEHQGYCTYDKVFPTLYLSFLECPNGRHVREEERSIHPRRRISRLGPPLPATGEPSSV